jgi:transposase
MDPAGPGHGPSGSWPTRPTPTLDPRSDARAHDRVHQPGKERPDRPPPPEGLPRRPPPRFDPEIYTDRTVVERCFNRLKQFRDLATRYAKRVAYHRAEILIAAIVLWLRQDSQDTA